MVLPTSHPYAILDSHLTHAMLTSIHTYNFLPETISYSLFYCPANSYTFFFKFHFKHYFFNLLFKISNKASGAHCPLDPLTWLLPQPPGITRQGTFSAPAPPSPGSRAGILLCKGSLVASPFHLLLAAFQHLSSFAACGEALTLLGPGRGYLCFPQGWPVTSDY